MRNTKENVIKLTEKLIEMSNRQAMDKENDESVRTFERHNAIGMLSILLLLTDKEFFDSMWEIWGDEIE